MGVWGSKCELRVGACFLTRNLASIAPYPKGCARQFSRPCGVLVVRWGESFRGAKRGGGAKHKHLPFFLGLPKPPFQSTSFNHYQQHLPIKDLCGEGWGERGRKKSMATDHSNGQSHPYPSKNKKTKQNSPLSRHIQRDPIPQHLISNPIPI